MIDVFARLQGALSDRYRLERELGQGGMATVYLAHDLKHDRQVALKVLRPELAAALGAERFLREITTTAHLTHPHILPIHDSGEADGTLFYVMPYVEGESLRDRLIREPMLPLDEALRIAQEVADALSYAHSHGVVHRDVKPENILLEAGHAVVADFGIARALSAAGGDRLTETGLAVGTPAYMSPEQASGDRQLDGRSDIYSLGCVLFEMLSGETPYTGPTPQAILAKKLSEPLPRISVLRESVGPGLETTLNRALARTPADRWPTAAQFAESLATPPGVPVPTPMRRVARGRWVVGAAVVVVIAVVVGLTLRLRPLTITTSDIRPVTSDAEVEFEPAISPDGSVIAYAGGLIGSPYLVIRSATPAGGGGEVRLPDTLFRQTWFPRFAADGETVRFLGCPPAGRCAWYETGKLGGAARALTVPRSATLAWSPDGARIALARRDTLFIGTPPDTTLRPVAVTRATYTSLNSLAWSPDGQRIAYVDGNNLWLRSANVMPTAIWVVEADGGEPRRVTSNRCQNVSPAWLDDRHLLYVSTCDGPRGVYVVAVGRHGASGAPRAVPGTTDAHTISYSRSARRLVFSKLVLHQNIFAYRLDRTAPTSIGDGQPVTSGVQAVEENDVSADGRWIVYNSNLHGNFDIYRVPAMGGAGVPITDDPADEYSPAPSPDGREVAFLRQVLPDSAGVSGMSSQPFVVSAEGGTATPILPPGLRGHLRWAPDGRTISFAGPDGHLWLVSRDSARGAWHAPVQVTDFSCPLPNWTRDGSGVTCVTGAPRQLLLVSPSGNVLWRREQRSWAPLHTVDPINAVISRDGRTIYAEGTHTDGRRGVWAVPVRGRGEPRLVVAFDDPSLTLPPAGGMFSIGPEHLYFPVSQYESDIWMARLRY